MDKQTFDKAVVYAQSGSQFADSSYHGDVHWRGVATQGLWLCDALNLDKTARLTALVFGLFHDCRRHNEHHDPDHGERGAQALFDSGILPENDTLHTLCVSMLMHDSGGVSTNTNQALGWDADRSLLGRVGIDPNPKYFSLAKPGGPADFDAFVALGEQRWFQAPDWDTLYHTAMS